MAGRQDRPSFRGRWAIPLLLGVQLVIGGFGVWTWRSGGDAVPQPAEGPVPTPGVDTPRPATVESALPLAMARAREWRDDAQLLSVSAELDWSREVPGGVVTELPEGGWLIYLFVASWERFGRNEEMATLSLLIERTTGGIYGETTVGWETGPAPLPAPLTTYPISSTIAVIVAEARGGTAFRRACPGLRYSSRIGFDVTADGAPVWTVTYLDDRARDRNAITVRVDAVSGNVVEYREMVTPCPETAYRRALPGPLVEDRPLPGVVADQTLVEGV